MLLGLIFFFRHIRQACAYVLLMLATMGLDARRILPYTPIWRLDSVIDSQVPGVDLKLMTANVLQFNLEFGRLLDKRDGRPHFPLIGAPKPPNK